MREYIKANKHAVLMLFHRGSDADHDHADRIKEYNMDIASRIFDGIMDGSIATAYQRKGPRLIIYHRSTRGDFVQASYFLDRNGDTIATMHEDITEPAKMESSFMHGKYINIVA